MENKTFCILPWVHLAVDTTGETKPCCISTETYKKEDGSSFNFGYDSTEDIFNSSHIKKIRQDMLLGNEVEGCQECYSTEKNGGKSNRLSYNQHFSHVDIDNPKLEYFDLRFGNMCNLACKSCSPRASSTLSKELTKIPELANYYSLFGNVDSWYITDRCEQNIDSHIFDTKLYYLTGGEPTIISQNIKLLEKLLSYGLQEEVMIIFNTNMTNSSPNFYKLISKFKNIVALASIDGFGKTQEYLRYPSKWKAIEKNLHRLIDAGAEIQLTPVIQIGNLNTCVELFEYVKQLNANVRIAPIDLYQPAQLDIRYLPHDYKVMCWDRIASWLDDNSDWVELRDKLESIKNKCHEVLDESVTRQKLIEYVKFNKAFDVSRKTDIADYNPELAELLRKYAL